MIHTCHAPGCDIGVPPRYFACNEHWTMLPRPLRDRIWATYVPGQEITKTPTPAYLAAAADARAYLRERLSA